MELAGWHFWLGAAVVVLILILVFRRSGFRASAEAFGAKLEVEGKGGERPAGDKAATPRVPSQPTCGTASARVEPR